jgi:hypothetical protein
MERRAAKVLTDLGLASLIIGTVYSVSMLFPSTFSFGRIVLSGTVSDKFLAASIFVSLELLVVAVAKKSDRFALSSMVVLAIGVLLGYFVL